VITRAWLAWKRVAHGIGTFRARGVLTSYFVVMLPFGIVFVVLSIWAWGQSSCADRYSTIQLVLHYASGQRQASSCRTQEKRG
jgi:hypothetical protein